MTTALFVLLSDNMGGAERFIRNLAREAARSKRFDHVEVFILCWPRSGTLDELEAKHGVTLHYAFAQRISGGVLPLLRKMISQRFDMVFTSAVHVNAVASLARRFRLLRTRRLVTRESTMLLERDFGWRSRFVGLLLRTYGGQDLIICQTEDMRASLDQYTAGRLRKKLRVFANPLDREMIEAGLAISPLPEVSSIPSGRTKIAWCGRLEHVKSPDRAIGTLAALHARGEHDMHLFMIGDGSLRSNLEQQADAAGLSSFVTFVGHHPLPSSIMADCDLGLLTSDLEGFPNVVLEMLASGIHRIVSTNCAGDLRNLPGVAVVPIAQSTSENLAEALLSMKGRPATIDIEPTIRERDVASFLECLLADLEDLCK